MWERRSRGRGAGGPPLPPPPRTATGARPVKKTGKSGGVPVGDIGNARKVWCSACLGRCVAAARLVRASERPTYSAAITHQPSLPSSTLDRRALLLRYLLVS